MLGLYILRFVPAKNTRSAASLELSYMVSQHGLTETSPKILNVYAPGAGANFSTKTQFQWQAIAGSYLYRLEFYPAEPRLNALPMNSKAANEAINNESEFDDEAPLTGMLVPGAQTKAAISTAVSQRLQVGQSYRWRIAAIDSKGNTIGVSEWQNSVNSAP